MFKYVVGTREPEPLASALLADGKRIHDINLIGEYNIAGELWHVLPLLDELGLRVLCTLSGEARFYEVQTMHRAEANMMVCSKVMVNVARKLQEKYVMFQTRRSELRSARLTVNKYVPPASLARL